MKKFIISLFIVFATTYLAVNAQTLKFGHIDSQKLLELMPQRDSAMKVLQKEYDDTQQILDGMQVELNKKYQKYLESSDSLSSIAKKTKEQEMQDLQQRIQNYQQTAQDELQKKETALFNPIMDKAKK